MHFFVLLTNLLSWAAHSEGVAASWELIDDRSGIQVFRKEVPGSPVLAFKGVATISAPILKVASVLVDAKRASEWVNAVRETRIVRTVSKWEAILYTHVGTPVLMKDRDFVCRVQLDFNHAAKSIVLSYVPAIDPEAPQSRFIRGEMIDSSFTMESISSGTETKVTAIVHADPKGSIAKWIVNLFQKAWPRKTMESLRRQVAKTDIILNEDIRAALSQPPKK